MKRKNCTLHNYLFQLRKQYEWLKLWTLNTSPLQAATFNVKNLAHQALQAPGLRLAALFQSSLGHDDQQQRTVGRAKASSCSEKNESVHILRWPCRSSLCYYVFCSAYTRSDSVEVAGTASYVLASLATWGKRDSILRHYWRGSSKRNTGGSAK